MVFRLWIHNVYPMAAELSMTMMHESGTKAGRMTRRHHTGKSARE
jgi:hypothetical protein